MGRAKRVLMQRLNISEDEAHHLIRKEAMDKRTTMKHMAYLVMVSERSGDESKGDRSRTKDES